MSQQRWHLHLLPSSLVKIYMQSLPPHSEFHSHNALSLWHTKKNGNLGQIVWTRRLQDWSSSCHVYGTNRQHVQLKTQVEIELSKQWQEFEMTHFQVFCHTPILENASCVARQRPRVWPERNGLVDMYLTVQPSLMFVWSHIKFPYIVCCQTVKTETKVEKSCTHVLNHERNCSRGHMFVCVCLHFLFSIHSLHFIWWMPLSIHRLCCCCRQWKGNDAKYIKMLGWKKSKSGQDNRLRTREGCFQQWVDLQRSDDHKFRKEW